MSDRPSKWRRKDDSEASPHFSPEMQAPESDLAIHGQLLALSEQMVRPNRLPSPTL